MQKSLAWMQLPDDAALNSRCAIISLNESRRTDLSRPTEPHIVAEARALQRQLLRYRLENLNTVVLSPTPGDENLISRNRDLFQAFALAAEPWRKVLARIFTEQQALTREPLFPTHAAVLYQLYGTIHARRNASEEYNSVKKLTELVNRGLEITGDRMRLNPRQVGAALTALGISRRHRSAQGWNVVLTESDKKRIHDLIVTYGMHNNAFWPSFEECRNCPLCKGVRHPHYGIIF